MKVEIISRETIKPSSLTPLHLRTHKLSFLEQLAPPFYVSAIYFYRPTSQISADHLKDSLSRTLTSFNPFAGRIKDAFSIDCNDKGAAYVETHIAIEMSEVLNKPDTNLLYELLPHHPEEMWTNSSSDDEILSVNINNFCCGGLAIGVSILHKIADASTMATFVNAWAAVSRGGSLNQSFVSDCSAIFPAVFPPVEHLDRPLTYTWNNPKFDVPSKIVTKRLVFDKIKLSLLRKNLTWSGKQIPTRFEAVAALMWGVVITAAKETKAALKRHATMHLVNLRKRLDPPLPPHCIGSIVQGSGIVVWEVEYALDYTALAKKTHESIQMVTNEYIRKVHEDGKGVMGQFNEFKELGSSSESSAFGITSWCRFPLYDADFGWGKPVWIAPGLDINTNVAMLVDTRDGDGIEAWVKMTENNLTLFEENPDLLAYATLNPSI